MGRAQLIPLVGRPSRAMSEITEIVERVEPILGEIDGEPVPLHGGITN